MRRHSVRLRSEAGARSRGVALVVVLWVLVLLAVIAGNFAYIIRVELSAARNQVELAQARALVDAGIQRALYERLKPAADPTRWIDDGRPYEFQLEEGRVRVSIHSEAGKIDLNGAGPELMLALLQSVGVPDPAATALRDAILDWRDPDSTRRPAGAEAADYLQAGLDHLPANAPFVNIEELQQVMGMTPEIYARVAPMVTTAHGQPGIDPLVARPDVLRVFGGGNVDSLLQYRAQATEAARQGLPPPPLPVAIPYLNPGMAAAIPALTIRSEAELPSGVRWVRELTVRLRPSAAEPVEVLGARSGEAARDVPSLVQP